MSEPIVIDTNMHGYPGVTATYLLRGERTALVETGPKSRVDDVSAGLEREGVEDLDLIVVTHIHLDHAGAAGTLARRFPGATVCVHEVGAPHLVDPSKLWASASRIYGDAMESMWGGIDPLPEERIRTLSDGDVIDLGGRALTAYDTPGHAGHHHVLLDDTTGALFTGDALGVKLQGVEAIRPATPPPEFHLEKAKSSIDKIRDLGAARLYPTHFGPLAWDVAEACERATESLDRWAEWVKEARSDDEDLDRVAESVRRKDVDFGRSFLGDDDVARLEQTTSYRMNVSGYARYFDKNPGA